MKTNQNIIMADFREQRSKVPSLLKQLGVSVQTGNFSADYVIGRDCFVERKTISDFITSILNGRLFRQVSDLAKNCANPLVLLEGGGLYCQGRVPGNMIRGSILWVSLTKKVPLIRTKDEQDTACMLYLLAKKRLNASNQDVQRYHHHQPRHVSPWQRQVNILTQIPGIGKQAACDMLAIFKSADNIIKASDLELMSLPGIGKERLKSIRQIFPSQSPKLDTV